MLVTAFSSFPTVFSSLPQREIVILATLNFSSASAFSLVMSKNLSFGKGLISTSQPGYIWQSSNKPYAAKKELISCLIPSNLSKYYESINTTDP